jgi:hypothetical protein
MTQTYQIVVNGDRHIVLRYVTAGQIKRLAGCDNEYYSVVFQQPVPEEYQGKSFSDGEVMDLEAPYAVRFFETKFYQEL